MRITLDIDDNVIAAARELATIENRTLDEVVSDLARQGIGQAKVELGKRLLVIQTPMGSALITPDTVRRALEGD